MNYGLIVICDEDPEYADCLADYFRIKGCLASEIVVFTKQSPFVDFVEKNVVDILIIHEKYFQSMTNVPLIKNVFVLCENSTSDMYTNVNTLFKYTSAEELLRQVMANYVPTGTRACLSFHKYKKGKVLGVCSPLGRCGKTSLALSLGLKLSLKHSCLFISFDDASSLRIFSSDGESLGKSISDLIYYFFQSPDLLESKLMSGIRKIQSMDFIPPSEQSCIYSEVSVEDLAAFLSKLIDMGKYDYIIVDFGMLSFTFPLLKLCDHIFLAELENDSYSASRISAYLDFIHNHNQDNRIALHRVSIPHVTFSPDASQYLFNVTSGELGHFTASLLQSGI